MRSIEWEELEPLIEDRLLRRVAISALGRTGRAEALDPLFSALDDAVDAAPWAPRRRRSSKLLARARRRARSCAASTARSSARARAPAWRAVLAGASEAELRRAAAELLAYAKERECARPDHRAADARRGLSRDAGGAARAGAKKRCSRWSRSRPRSSHPRSAQSRSSWPPIWWRCRRLRAAPLGRLVRDSLRPALHDHDPVVVAAAARSLGPYVEASDADTLVQCALSVDPEVARSAARALEVLVATARDAVEQAIRNVEVETPQAAALASVLAMLGGPEALDRLRGLLSSDDPHVRRAALHALGRIGGARAAAMVALALADENSDVQVAAAQVLGRLRDERGGVPGASELMLAVQSEHAQVRAAVARALGATGLAASRRAAAELLRDDDGGVAIAAIDALGQLTHGTLSETAARCPHPSRSRGRQGSAARAGRGPGSERAE